MSSYIPPRRGVNRLRDEDMERIEQSEGHNYPFEDFPSTIIGAPTRVVVKTLDEKLAEQCNFWGCHELKSGRFYCRRHRELYVRIREERGIHVD